MTDDQLIEQGEKVVRKKMKPRGGNSPMIGENGIHTLPGDNSKYAAVLLEMHKWGEVDKNDPEALEERFWKYVEFCGDNDIRVTNQVAYYAMGISKDDVYNWEHGVSRGKEHCELIKKVKRFCASYREMLGADGRLNPVTLVWWQKNYDGLVDRSEVVLTPNQPLGSEPDQKALEDKIIGSIVAEE
jgi:hypothetical protein